MAWIDKDCILVTILPSQTGGVDGNGTLPEFTFPLIDTDGDGTTDNNAVLQFGNKMTYAVYVDNVLQDPSTAYTANDLLLLQLPQLVQCISVKYNTEVITSL